MLTKTYLSLCLVAAFVNSAQCASFQQTSDGNVIFQALGERMSLRLSDFRDRLSFKDDLRFTAPDCLDSVFPHLPELEKFRIGLRSDSLGKGVLEQDPFAKCIWDKIRTDKPATNDKNSYLYTFFVDFAFENKFVFPGGLPFDEVSSDMYDRMLKRFSFDLIAQNPEQDTLLGFTFSPDVIDPAPGMNIVRRFLREEWPPHPCQPQAAPGEIKAGFENRGRVILADKRYWNDNISKEIVIKQTWDASTQFFLPAEKRLGNATAPLCVICGGVVFSSQACTIYLWSSDKAVRFEMRWSERGKPSPSEEWIKADFTARKIAHSIFIDRPEGDFQ